MERSNTLAVIDPVLAWRFKLAMRAMRILMQDFVEAGRMNVLCVVYRLAGLVDLVKDILDVCRVLAVSLIKFDDVAEDHDAG